MTDLQKGLLDLLKEIDAICRKYSIEYYLGGGTFVGAVRHGYFLPWDDDADIHMTLANAKKFAEAVRKENLPHRLVYTNPIDETNAVIVWRYVSTESTAISRLVMGTSDLKGQFIDIIVLCPTSKNAVHRAKQIERLKLYSELKRRNSTYVLFRSESFIKQYKAFAFFQKIIGRRVLLNYLGKKVFGYPEKNSGNEWLVVSPITVRLQPKSYWGNPKYISFEDTTLPVAEHPEKLLSFAYGANWFEVPAYMERGHHIFVTDMDIPCAAYEKDMNAHMDIDATFTQGIELKEAWFDIMLDRNISMPRLRSLQGYVVALEIQNKVEENHLDLKEMTEQGLERELADLFLPYFQTISSNPFKFYNLYLDMPDEYLYAAVYFQCFNGRYSVAKKVLGMRRTRVTRALSPNLQRLCDLCDATDNLLTTLYGDLDLQAARAIADEWLAKEPTALYFLRADIYLRLNGFGAESDEELLRRCDRYLEQYADDGELLKYRGDLLLKLGQREEGERCYRKALCNLRNGFCIRAVKEYFGEGRQLEVVE